MKRVGIHTAWSKDTQVLGIVEKMIEFGSTSAAAYIGSSKSYQRNYEVDVEKAKEAKELAKANGISLEDIIIHGPILINLANTEKEHVLNSSYDVALKDLQNMQKMGLKLYNIHPGSNKDAEAGIKKVIEQVNKLLEVTKGDKTTILIETMMTKGNYIGKNFEQVGQIIKGINNKKRIGVCLDTCHIWDGGYDISDNLDGVLEEFEQEIGLKYLKAIHLNDSKNELGSGKDRHENVGDGFIGTKALKSFVNHELIKELPIAMETPAIKIADFDSLKRQRDLL